MKKKKLKKKIEKLEKKYDKLFREAVITRNALNTSEAHVQQCKEAITKLETEAIDKKEERSIKNTLTEFDKRIMILETRTQTDYTKFSEKTCATCKWEPLIEQGVQDMPCMGCTANDKKMWKSKED